MQIVVVFFEINNDNNIIVRWFMEEKIIIFRIEKDFNPINDAAIEFKIIIIIILFFDNSIEIIIIGKNF